MNNILDEITYSDGRMENGCTSSFVDSPAKLKLRARTYEGITRSVRSRRAPLVKESRFQIPNAYMPMDVSGSDTSGGNSFYTPIASVGLDNITEVSGVKKLKVSANQFLSIKNGAVKMQEQVMPSEPVAEHVQSAEVNNQVAPEVDSVAYTPSVEEEVESKQVVENEPATPEVVAVEPVSENKTVEEKQETVSMDQQIDAVREKAFQQATPVEPMVEEKTATDQAMETDAFANLEKSTQMYSQTDEDYQKSKALVETRKEELEASKDLLAKMDIEEEEKRNAIREHQNVIDSALKEIEDLKNLDAELTIKINEKIKKVNAATEKLKLDKKRHEEEAARISEENAIYQQKIDVKRQSVEEMEAEGKSLSREEAKVLEEKAKVQEDYNRRLEIYNALDLPVAIENQEVVEEQPELPKAEETVSSENNIVDFPYSFDFDNDATDNVIEDDLDKVYSYGSRRIS